MLTEKLIVTASAVLRRQADALKVPEIRMNSVKI